MAVNQFDSELKHRNPVDIPYQRFILWLSHESYQRIKFPLYTPRPHNYHVSDMKPFVFDSVIVDPLDIARGDQMDFFIEKILDHRGKLSHRKSLQFVCNGVGGKPVR